MVFAAATLAGAEISPSVEEAPEHGEGEVTMQTHETEIEADAHGGHEAGASEGTLPGLASSQGGYQLIPERTRFRASGGARFDFRVVDAAGETVHDFDIDHTRPMHLIVIRRDFADFQHLHPVQRDDGSWTARADLGDAGVYRAFADFSVDGQSLTLAGDVFVAGDFEPAPLPAPATSADAGDGYEVEITSAAPAPGQAAAVEFQVSRNGERLSGVEPYLGADGHLVALREHDQAFLHTHPEGEPGGSGPISFMATYPSPGSYRLFLQFKHGGKVRTAAFTQVAEAGATGEAEQHSEDSHEAG